MKLLLLKRSAFLLAALIISPLGMARIYGPVLSIETLFTLQRTNYKPEKLLRFDLHFHGDTCEITGNPYLDVFYVTNQNGKIQRIEMSDQSRQMLTPKIVANSRTDKSFLFTFEALSRMNKVPLQNRKIEVQLTETNGVCQAKALFNYQNKKAHLQHIDIEVSKLFGAPTGIASVKARTINDKGISEWNCWEGHCK